MKTHQKLTVKLTSNPPEPEKLDSVWCGFSNQKLALTHTISTSERMLLRSRWWRKKSHHHTKLFNCQRLMIHHYLNQRRLTSLLQSKYRSFFFEKKTSDKEMIWLSRKNQSLNKENIVSSRKKSSLCSNSLKLSNALLETKNASLNVLTSKNINFRINVVNIIQKKRVRKSSKDFTNTTWINEKMTRILVFYTIMMIVFNTKT
jgi:hypothetical protein